MQLKFDTVCNIYAGRLGITKATIANWNGKASRMIENPKQISYYIDSKMTELKVLGDIIRIHTRN